MSRNSSPAHSSAPRVLGAALTLAVCALALVSFSPAALGPQSKLQIAGALPEQTLETLRRRQIGVVGGLQLSDQPAWMGFRSSIDGFNVNQHCSTGPGGAQDHQDPVPCSNGVYPWGSPTAIGAPGTVGGASTTGTPATSSGTTNSAGSGFVGYDRARKVDSKPLHRSKMIRTDVNGLQGQALLMRQQKGIKNQAASWPRWPTMQLSGYPYDKPTAFDSDPKHGFGGYGGGDNAGAYQANPGGSYYCADCTW